MKIFGRNPNKSNGNSDNGSKKNLLFDPPDDDLATFRTMAYDALMDQMDFVAANQMTPEQLRHEVEQFIADLSSEKRIKINSIEQKQLALSLVDDMIGLGPLEEILHDDSVTDILVNGPQEVYVERQGRLEKIHLEFHDEMHLEQIARRIASQVGRRIDESSPMVDARLADGSRVNIIMPPLSLEGTSISIRKFSRVNITLDNMIAHENLS